MRKKIEPPTRDLHNDEKSESESESVVLHSVNIWARSQFLSMIPWVALPQLASATFSICKVREECGLRLRHNSAGETSGSVYIV